MKTIEAKHSPWRDMRRDWDGWSPLERRIVRFLTLVSMVSAALWFALSLNLIN